MVQLGYALSSEEQEPRQLVALAKQAERSGFEFLMISDHYHPWITAQGHAPFIWTVIGGIAMATDRIPLGTGVTCPTTRYHPAIVAQAAATASLMMEGRFMLGLGSGEALNEHILAHHWPPADVRVAELEEAIDIIRDLWTGEEITHHGEFFEVERARLFDVPKEPPQILVAASAASSAELAAVQDGLITTSPNELVLNAFDSAGGRSKPKYGQLTVSYAKDEASARRNAYESWPNSALPWNVLTEIETPEMFDSLVALLREEDVAESIVCFSEPGPCIEAIKTYQEAGFDHIYLHQVGTEQQAFMEFFQSEIAPVFASKAAA